MSKQCIMNAKLLLLRSLTFAMKARVSNTPSFISIYSMKVLFTSLEANIRKRKKQLEEDMRGKSFLGASIFFIIQNLSLLEELKNYIEVRFMWFPRV